MREYDSINPKVLNPIMNRSYSVMDREQAHAVMLGEGYDQVVIEMLERWSAGSGPDFGTGYTHVPNGPNDHYWRLIVAEGIWYFQYVDHSPRVDTQETAC